MKIIRNLLEISLEQIENDLSRAEEAFDSFWFDELLTKRAEIKMMIRALDNDELSKNHTQKLH